MNTTPSSMSPAVANTDSRFDVLKFILAIMIMALHTNLWPQGLMPWLRIAVPVFFIVSSYFFFRKVLAIDSAAEARAALRHFVARSALLYLFWFVVNLPATEIIYGYFRDGILHGLLYLAYDAVFGATFVASWFISANILATCIIFMLRRHKAVAFILGIAMFAMCCATSSYYHAFPAMNGWLTDTLPRFYFYFSFPAALLWVWAGMMAAASERKGHPALWAAAAALGAVALWLEYKWVGAAGFARDNDCYFSLAIICPAIFMAVRALPPSFFPASIVLRRLSVIFYCSHGSIARLTLRYFRTHAEAGFPVGPVTFAVTLLGCSLISAIILLLGRRNSCRILRFAY